MAEQQGIFQSDLYPNTLRDSGILTWNIKENIVHADCNVAEHFGLNANACEHGVPVEDFLARVHEADRILVVRDVTDRNTSPHPRRSSFRALNSAGQYSLISLMGTLFRDIPGNPVQFAGIVTLEGAAQNQSFKLMDACLNAREIAITSGNELAAGTLDLLIGVLGG